MKKIVKKTGSSIGFIFTSEDAKIYNIEIGDLVEIGEPIIVRKVIKEQVCECVSDGN